MSVYQAESGQWSFVIKDDEGIELVRGGGFDCEDDARQEAENLLASYKG